MDYEKLYNKFIKDRRIKEQRLDLNEYTEVHHIIPRCMGGTNEKENLIKLIPEDHFFSHLLLAKAYGGKNWAALKSMIFRGMKTKDINYKIYRRKRKDFAIARKLLLKQLSGLNNHSSDKTIYHLKNVDGREVNGYKFELSKKLEIASSNLSKLIQGKKKSLNGWYYPKLNPEGIVGLESGQTIKRKNSKHHNLFHYDGSKWSGTSIEFKEQFGYPIVFSSDKPSCRFKGWFRSKEEAEKYLKINEQKTRTERKLWKVSYKEEIFLLKKKAIKEKFNLSDDQISNLLSGKIKKCKGLTLLEEKNTNYNKVYNFQNLKTGEKFRGNISEASEKFNVRKINIYNLVNNKIQKGVTKGIRLIN